jgi:hypothetical protein
MILLGQAPAVQGCRRQLQDAVQYLTQIAVYIFHCMQVAIKPNQTSLQQRRRPAPAAFSEPAPQPAPRVAFEFAR